MNYPLADSLNEAHIRATSNARDLANINAAVPTIQCHGQLVVAKLTASGKFAATFRSKYSAKRKMEELQAFGIQCHLDRQYNFPFLIVIDGMAAAS